ncbi:YbaY family lipoprotein [Natronospora cellulosivora (SeqCode)]
MLNRIIVNKKRVIIFVVLIVVILTGFVEVYSYEKLEKIKLEGSVYYRERMLLLPGSTIKISLINLSIMDTEKSVLLEEEIKPEGQVPVPFTLEIDRNDLSEKYLYGLRAQITSKEDTILWITPEVTMLDPFKQKKDIDLLLKRLLLEEDTIQNNFATAEGIYFIVQNNELQSNDDLNEIEIIMPGGKIKNLTKVPAASGAKYSNGDIVFWNKGKKGMIQVDDIVYNTKLEDFEDNNGQKGQDLLENRKTLAVIKEIKHNADSIRVLIDNKGQELLLNISDETEIIGIDNKQISYDKLKEVERGSKIIAYYKPTMALSLPPQSAAVKIVILPYIKDVSSSKIDIYKTEDIAYKSQSLEDKAREEISTFKALGQEPGWSLEVIEDKNLTLITNYGESKLNVSMNQVKKNIINNVLSYSIETSLFTMKIEVIKEEYTDTMSGKKYPYTVKVRISDKELIGGGYNASGILF